jgi:hypothetical protein
MIVIRTVPALSRSRVERDSQAASVAAMRTTAANEAAMVSRMIVRAQWDKMVALGIFLRSSPLVASVNCLWLKP